MNKIAYVSKGPDKIVDNFKPPVKPQMGVRNWPFALNCTRLKWETIPLKEISLYDVFLVNLYPQSKHAYHIKLRNPNAFIIGMPDPHLERVFQVDFDGIHSQLQYCDVIGARTKAGVRVYQALYPNKNVYWLPSPIGPTSAFVKLQIPYEERQDIILSIDHRSTHTMTIQNVLACKQLQDELGWPVHYYNAMPRSIEYANMMGLDVVFLPKTKWQAFVKAAANYKVCVDMYAVHANHRHGQVMGLLKVPMFGSALPNQTTYDEDYNLFRLQHIFGNLKFLFKDDLFEDFGTRSFKYVNANYSFKASKERVERILQNENIQT
jgi:hypothetical protein